MNAMKYIAHAGVKLKNGVTGHTNYEWNYIKTIDGIEYRWKFGKDRTYEVVAGLFDNKSDALIRAKTMYVTLLFSLLKGQFLLDNAGCSTYEPRFFDKERDVDYDSFQKTESFFFWNKHLSGGRYGPGVYEVESSFDELEEYKFFNFKLSVSYDSDLTLDNVDEYVFVYNRKAQELMSSIVVADAEMDYGMKMTIYCSILEHLSENGKKSEAVQEEIDKIVKLVKESGLLTNEKDQLISYLNFGKELSAIQKCRKLIEKYAAPQYSKFLATKILSEAYSIRSAFSHGDSIDSDRINASHYMKYLVLDVIKGYMRELESSKN